VVALIDPNSPVFLLLLFFMIFLDILIKYWPEMAKKGIQPRAHGCEGMRWDRVPLVLHFTSNKWSKCAWRCEPKKRG
jgi:hypothetical protein